MEGFVATEAQRLVRSAWEAYTLPLSYARLSPAVAEAGGVGKYTKVARAPGRADTGTMR